MAPSKKWNETQTIKFVSAYKETECLWNIQHDDYKTRSARDSAYQRLVETMNIRGFGPTEVKKKIKNLRNTYTQEVTKMTKDETFRSNLKWFSTAHRFLSGAIISKKDSVLNPNQFLEIVTEGSCSPPRSSEDSRLADSGAVESANVVKATPKQLVNRRIKSKEISDNSNMVTISCADHHDKLVEGLWQFLQLNHGVNFDFHWGGRLIRAHRLILDVFLSASKLKQQGDQLPSSDHDFLLEFLYKGRVTVKKDRVPNLLKLAEETDFLILVDAVQSIAQADEVESESCETLKRSKTQRKSRCDDSGSKDTANPKVEESEDPFVEEEQSEDATKSPPVRVSTEVPSKPLVTSDKIVAPRSNVLRKKKRRDSPAPLTEEEDDDMSLHDESSDSDEIDKKRAKRGDSEFCNRSLHSDEIFRCEQCPKIFPRERSLLAHKKTHVKLPTYVCHVCSKTFTQQRCLSVHLRIHGVKPNRANKSDPSDYLPVEEAPHKCKVCGEGFASFTTLESHVLSSHPEKKTFRCDQCSKSFRKQKLLRAHRQIHTKHQTYICHLCPKTFSVSRYLRIHLRVHEMNSRRGNDSDPIQPVVEREPTKESPAIEEDPFKCKVCGESYPALKPLEAHLLSSHPDEKTFRCNECPKAFSRRQPLLTHKKTHSKLTPYACHLCTKKFAVPRYLQVHLRVHYVNSSQVTQSEQSLLPPVADPKSKESSADGAVDDDDENPYNCTACGEGFPFRLTLEKHAILSHPGTKIFRCVHCSKSFERHRFLLRHLETHSEGSSFKCHVCSEKFPLFAELRQHSETHDTEAQRVSNSVIDWAPSARRKPRDVGAEGPVEEDPYKCEVCGHSFRFRVTYETHLLTTHPGAKAFRCSHCQKSFARYVRLQRHMECHKEGKNYMCHICSKTFTLPRNLMQHSKIHTGKTHQCHQCGSAFFRRTDLNVHLLSHAGIKPFKCKYCDQTFAYRQSRSVHTRTHTGEKRYVCSFCPMTFTNGTSRQSHEYLHTGERPHRCPKCYRSFRARETMRRHLRNNGCTSKPRAPRRLKMQTPLLSVVIPSGDCD